MIPRNFGLPCYADTMTRNIGVAWLSVVTVPIYGLPKQSGVKLCWTASCGLLVDSAGNQSKRGHLTSMLFIWIHEITDRLHIKSTRNDSITTCSVSWESCQDVCRVDDQRSRSGRKIKRSITVKGIGQSATGKQRLLQAEWHGRQKRTKNQWAPQASKFT